MAAITPKDMAYVSITPVKAKFNDALNSIFLCVRIVTDNLVDACLLYWELRDETDTAMLQGNATISGEDYTSWTGDNGYVFTFVAETIGVTIA